MFAGKPTHYPANAFHAGYKRIPAISSTTSLEKIRHFSYIISHDEEPFDSRGPSPPTRARNPNPRPRAQNSLEKSRKSPKPPPRIDTPNHPDPPRSSETQQAQGAATETPHDAHNRNRITAERERVREASAITCSRPPRRADPSAASPRPRGPRPRRRWPPPRPPWCRPFGTRTVSSPAPRTGPLPPTESAEAAADPASPPRFPRRPTTGHRAWPRFAQPLLCVRSCVSGRGSRPGGGRSAVCGLVGVERRGRGGPGGEGTARGHGRR